MPAFVGLGAPYWDPDARGAILGLTRGSGAAEIARATLDSIAYQVRDVVEAMDADLGSPLRGLRVDGGGAGDLVCQLVADQLGRPVERPVVRETTAFGAAALAGLAVGFWDTPAEIAALRRVERRFEPSRRRRRRGPRPDAPGTGPSSAPRLGGCRTDGIRATAPSVRPIGGFASIGENTSVQVRRQSSRLPRGKAVDSVTASSYVARRRLGLLSRLTREPGGIARLPRGVFVSCTTTRI